MALPNRVSKLPINQLFLIDGIGALVSAVFLGVVLVRLEPIVGMPLYALYLLAFLALIFAAYSLSCYAFNQSNQKYLRFIALVNGSYCLLTLGLVIFYFKSLTYLGILYFGVEIIIILSLVRLEWNHQARNSGSGK